MTLPLGDDLLGTLLARCKTVPLSRFSQPLFWLLLLLLAYQCAGLTWRLIELGQIAPAPAWQPAPATGKGGEASRLDLGGVSQLALFGKLQPVPGANGAAGGGAGGDGSVSGDGSGSSESMDRAIAANAPRTQLNAQLTGVLASTVQAKSIAIIAYNGKQNTYGIGDYIDGTQVKIRMVLADRIILVREGRDETLMLDGEEYGTPLPEEKPRQGGALSSSVRSELMSSPGKITDYLNIVPVRVDGSMAGYRLSPGSKPELFNQLGLVAGDLAVGLNGLDLRDNAQAMQAMQQLAGATELTITVERQGQRHDVSVGLSE